MGSKSVHKDYQERLNKPQAAAVSATDARPKFDLFGCRDERSLSLTWRSFVGIYLQDSTTIALPSDFVSLRWRGSGNQTGVKAGLKVQTVFNYQNGQLQLQLAAAKCA